jgi:dCTP deaminase
MKSGDIALKPDFETSQIKPASVDLRLGSKVIKTAAETKVVNLAETGGYLTIEGSEFVAVQTYERIELSNKISARFGLRSYFTRKGLLMFSGPQIDPGFKGILTVSVFNASNRTITIRYKEQFCTVEFSRIDTPASQGYGDQYQGQDDFRSEDVSYLMEVKGMTFAQVVVSVQGLQNSVGELSKSVETLKSTIAGVEASFTKAVSDLKSDITSSLQWWFAGMAIIIAVVLPTVLYFLTKFFR